MLKVDEQLDNGKKMPQGKIKWYDPQKGYGFIMLEGKPDVFVHKSDLPEGMVLEQGMQVEFEVVRSRKGPYAAELRILEPGDQEVG